MKFRNKATKEIRKAEMRDDGIYLYSETAKGWRKCDWEVLAKYWEEYREEPNEWWYIDIHGPHKVTNNDEYYQQVKAASKEIGNYFDTEEEAELAVRKLKAWKRLKDKGFSIYSWGYEFDMVDKPTQTIILRASAVDSNNTDLDLLFGGEE